MIKFGFILSCWKHCLYVDECIDSIINQKYQNLEIVFQGEKCQHKFDDKRIISICDGKRLGHVERLNRAVRIINADYIQFMGVDDLLRPDILETISQKIRDTKRKEWYYGDHYQITKNGIIEQKAGEFKLNKLTKKCYIAGGTVFVRQDIAIGFKFNEVLGLGNDWLMWCRLGKLYNPGYFGMPIYYEQMDTSTIRKFGTMRIRRWLIKRRIQREAQC